jgi:hypothetical protein
MSIGTFVLHRFAGDEVYLLKSATIDYATVGDGVQLTFTARAAPGALQTVPDTAQFPAAPHAEAIIFLPQADAHMLVGQRFVIPTSYDKQQDEHLATIYYYEHKDLDNTVIDVLAQEQNRLHICWHATTRDVNYYDGSQPATEVVIEGLFSVTLYQQDQ